MNDSAICVVFGNSGPSGLCSVFILNSKIAGPCVFDPISPCSCFVMKLYSISVHIYGICTALIQMMTMITTMTTMVMMKMMIKNDDTLECERYGFCLHNILSAILAIVIMILVIWMIC